MEISDEIILRTALALLSKALSSKHIKYPLHYLLKIIEDLEKERDYILSNGGTKHDK